MVEIKRIPFDCIVEYMRPTFAGDDADIEVMAREKAIECYSVNDGQLYFIARADQTAVGEWELVIMCARGRGLNAVVPTIIERAGANGFERIRFHTARPGLGRMLARHGVTYKQHVFEKDLKHE